MPEPTTTANKPSSLVKSRSFIRYGLLALLLAWYTFFLLHPINLIKADLGRHIKNGEQKSLINYPVTNQGLPPVLAKNFYSHTFPDFPFVNHHWLSGEVFYTVNELAGFVGLEIFFVVLSLVTFYIFYQLAEKEAGWLMAAPLAFFLIPLIADRTEVRPEVFSYLLLGIFFYILLKVRTDFSKHKLLWLLPLLMLFWINLHIYFAFGFFLIVVFWLEELFKKEKTPGLSKQLGIILALSTLAALFNPFVTQGLFYPLQIFNNYGLETQENQSVKTLLIAAPNYANLKIFILTLFSLLGLLAILFFKNKKLLNFSVVLITVVFGFLSYSAVRNLTMFGLFALPLLALVLVSLKPSSLQSFIYKKWFKIGAIIFMILLTLFMNRGRLPLVKNKLGLGLPPGNSDAALFIKDKNIKGPMFNDFDIGGYVIYYLWPQVKPFVDNRPEAYPTEFFTETYVPMHVNEELWQKKLKEYNFNVILYSFEDTAPWALPFIVKRLQDPAWVPVFTNKYAIIFVRNVSENSELIKEFKVDKNRFLIEAD